MPSEAMNVASAASRPKPLIAFAAVFGKKAMITAAAMGSQRVIERMLVIAGSPVAGGLRRSDSPVRQAPPRGAFLWKSRRCGVAVGLESPTYVRLRELVRSCQHPHE